MSTRKRKQKQNPSGAIAALGIAALAGLGIWAWSEYGDRETYGKAKPKPKTYTPEQVCAHMLALLADKAGQPVPQADADAFTTTCLEQFRKDTEKFAAAAPCIMTSTTWAQAKLCWNPEGPLDGGDEDSWEPAPTPTPTGESSNEVMNRLAPKLAQVATANVQGQNWGEQAKVWRVADVQDTYVIGGIMVVRDALTETNGKALVVLGVARPDDSATNVKAFRLEEYTPASLNNMLSDLAGERLQWSEVGP